MILTGNVGKLKVGFQVAATLGAWKLVRSDTDRLNNDTSDVAAKVASSNQFWSTQRPMVLGLWMGKSWWVWSNTMVEFDGAKAAIQVKGNPEALTDF